MYLVFAYDNYYPSGGFNDFKFTFKTLDEFEEKINIILNNTVFDYWYVVDLAILNNVLIGDLTSFDYKERKLMKNELVKNINRYLNDKE